ncbi:hypothetical protein MAHJHV33_50270 [Mycobacterium avium subsp. hominissuis]
MPPLLAATAASSGGNGSPVSPAELGGRLSHAIAEATLISRAEAARRVHTAGRPRRG